MEISKLLEILYQKLLSKKTKEKSERVILWIALVSFIIHLLMIGLIHFNVITINEPSNLLKKSYRSYLYPFFFYTGLRSLSFNLLPPKINFYLYLKTI